MQPYSSKILKKGPIAQLVRAQVGPQSVPKNPERFFNSMATTKNIIFDLGGVLLDIDYQKTIDAFEKLGLPHFEAMFSQFKADALFEKLETGHISETDFYAAIKERTELPLLNIEIDDAWNALLAGIPEQRLKLLVDIRNQYRIFLLSNSNEIHYLHYLQDFRINTGFQDFQDLFEKAYFSFMIHLSKPGKEVFNFVLKESRIDPVETLFIDDTLKHVETARSLGINGYYLDISSGEDVVDLFE